MATLERLRRMYTHIQTETRKGLEVARIKDRDRDITICYTELPSERVVLMTGLISDYIHCGVPLRLLDNVSYAVGVVVVQGQVIEVLASPVLHALVQDLQKAVKQRQDCINQFIRYLP